MRIAINTRFLLPDRLEGIGGFTHEIARRLVARRPDDEFFFFFDRPFAEQFIYDDNVQGVAVFPPARHPFLWYWWFEHSVPAMLRQHKIDLFFSPDGYCSLRTPVPTVMVTHDIAHIHYPRQVPRLARYYYQYFVPRYLRRAEQIVTVSSFVKKDIEQAYGIDPAKLTVACNGVRAAFQPLSLPEQAAVRQQYSNGAEYFFYIGAVHPRKNLARLIAAYDQFRSWTEAPVKLLIGGRLAWQTETVKQAHACSPYREDIQFLGYVPTADLPRLLGAALALVYVSLSEGFGVPLLEAMHAEVPIITSNVSSLPEVAGAAGLQVDPLQVGEIATALRDIYQLPHLGQQLVAAGRQQRKKFDWERATDVVEAAFTHTHRP